jgi:hypothetical protein
MKLLSEQTDEASLLRFGQEAVSLLEKRDFQSLADQFDYALKFDRSPVAAIEGDFQSSLAEYHALSEQPPAVPPSMVVKYFKPNSSNVFAVVECVFTAAEGCAILAELIVTSSGVDKHVTLEEVSLAKA